MEADAESYIQVLGRAMGVQLKRGGKDYMSSGGQDHDGEIQRDS